MFPLPHVRKPAPEQRGAGAVIGNGDLQSSREECVTAACPVQRFETLLSGPWRKIGSVQCFIYHIDKGLCVVPKEVVDRVTLVFTREDRLDQGGKFMRSERASDQTSTGWSVEVKGEEERIGE